jgi:dihydroorotate dehydrogenase
MYQLLLKFIKRIDNNHKFCFAYWWTRCVYFLERFNPLTPPLLSRPVNIMNLHFSNPVGLAAGFDRNGSLLKNINSSGFSFIEIGTVNVNSDIDTDKKLTTVVNNLQHLKDHTINHPLIGISLGSLRNNIDKHTVADYIKGLDTFWHYSDYIVINLSRPGSAMRSEENKNKELRILLEWIKHEHIMSCKKHSSYVPIIIKIAIEYKNKTKLPEILIIASELEFDGLLIAFENWPSSDEVITTVSKIYSLTNELPLIIVGGIKTAYDALKILNAGAKLVQCHSLLVEQGPIEMKKMIRKLTLIEK